jgi:hypothetical protein
VLEGEGIDGLAQDRLHLSAVGDQAAEARVAVAELLLLEAPVA